MEAWAKLSKLAYPVGARYGPDLNHPILNGKILRHVSVALANIQCAAIFPSYIAGTKSGTLGGGIDSHIGPWVAPTSESGSAHINITGQSTNADPALTMAVIFRTSAAPASNSVMVTNNSAGNICVSFGASLLLEIGQPFSTLISSTFTLAASTPYFFAFSVVSGTQRFVLCNLQSGQIQTATAATAITVSTSGGTVEWGDTGTSGQSSSCRVAAYMFAAGQSSLASLVQWAYDPWSFWYPQPDENWVGVSAAAIIDAPPAFWPRTWAPGWNLDRNLLLHRSPGPEFSLTPETNTHFIPRSFPPQWNRLALLTRGITEDFSQPETNTHFVPRAFPPQWNPLANLRQSPGDYALRDDPPSYVSGHWPPQWNLILWRLQGITEDFSQPETNTHFIPKALPPQWLRYPWQNPATDVPTVVTADTPPSFVPRTLPIQWQLNRSLGQGTAQDLTSPAVETNIHWIGTPWPVQWIKQSLLQTPAFDVPIAGQQDTPTYFVPRTWPVQWAVTTALRQGTSQDFTSPAVETNQNWLGRPWDVKWLLQQSLRQPATDVAAQFDTPTSQRNYTYPPQWLLSIWQNPATDVAPQVETPTYFLPRQLPPQWNINRSLVQGFPQDFSTIIVEGGVYANLTAWSPAWAPQWNLQRSLLQGTAQDFSSTAPVVTGVHYVTTSRAKLIVQIGVS